MNSFHSGYPRGVESYTRTARPCLAVKVPKLSKKEEAEAKKAEEAAKKVEASEPLRLILLRHGRAEWTVHAASSFTHVTSSVNVCHVMLHT